MTDIQQRLEAALAPLVACTSADEVADVLRAKGVKGRQTDCYTCPLVKYLSHRLGRYYDRIEVYQTYIEVWGRQCDKVIISSDDDSMVHIFQFIIRFDETNAFPDLIA